MIFLTRDHEAPCKIISSFRSGKPDVASDHITKSDSWLMRFNNIVADTSLVSLSLGEIHHLIWCTCNITQPMYSSDFIPCRLFGAKPLLEKICIIVIRNIRNKLQWNLNQNLKLSIQETTFENVIVKWRPFHPGGGELTPTWSTLMWSMPMLTNAMFILHNSQNVPIYLYINDVCWIVLCNGVNYTSPSWSGLTSNASKILVVQFFKISMKSA